MGRCVVTELANSDMCERVFVPLRRQIPASDIHSAFPDVEASKINKITLSLIDFERADVETMIDMAIEGEERGDGKVDAVFMCLGTTRSEAGGADAFRRVDYDYVKKIIDAAKKKNVSYFSQVSSSNANSSSFFLYPQTKGQIDDYMMAQKFDRMFIARPGLLNRKEKSRMWETVANYIVSGLDVAIVARAMVREFQTAFKLLQNPSVVSLPNTVTIMYDQQLRTAAAAM